MYPIPLVRSQVHDDPALSALPHAPVVPERTPRRPLGHALRAGRLVLAARLYAVARVVEPAPRCPEVRV